MTTSPSCFAAATTSSHCLSAVLDALGPSGGLAVGGGAAGAQAASSIAIAVARAAHFAPMEQLLCSVMLDALGYRANYGIDSFGCPLMVAGSGLPTSDGCPQLSRCCGGSTWTSIIIVDV